MCDAIHCKDNSISYTCGGDFCRMHKNQLIFLQTLIAKAKAIGNAHREYYFRKEVAKIRKFDRGHYQRFIRLERSILAL